MRALRRNKQLIYYSIFLGKVEKIDENGFYTGEEDLSYTLPQEEYVNVSPARGEASIELFGTDLNYTNTIVASRDLGWDENTILWIGRKEDYQLYPADDLFPDDTLYPDSILAPHNYIVVSIAKSLNSYAYAVRKVDVMNDNS